MRVVSETPGMKDFTIEGGKPITKARDGKFHVPDRLGKSLVKSGEFMAIGTTFRTAQGFVCQDCHRVNVFRNKCGKCGGSNLVPEA